MTSILAHSLDSTRTKDVILDESNENVSFESLMLNKNVLQGLTDSGFRVPSPIQVKAIPVGRCGFDLIVKAKSGTGKTLVFSIIALETIEVQKGQPEVLILAPTREIAVQIQEVLLSIGSHIKGLKVESFIGGFPIEGDKDRCKACHIAVGAPGRVKHLINEGILKTSSIRLMVLDEVDKLMESSFLNDINEIYNSLPDRKQIITTSATYSNELQNILSKYMLSPVFIAVENNTSLLLGLKQYVKVIRPQASVVQQLKVKNEEILKILSNISFTQCLVFTNFQTRAQSISNILNQNGWSSTYISAAQSQTERLSTVKDLKNFKCRILLSTDLTARGIDAANVDLVINYDIPNDAVTYLHRMGRAGRFGSSGICLNLAFEGEELKQLQNIIGVIGGQSLSIPKLPAFNGSIIDLLNVDVPSENHIYGTVCDTDATSTTKMDIKRDILELKESKISKKKNKPKVNKNNLQETSSDIKCKDVEKCFMDILNGTKEEVETISKSLPDIDPNTFFKSLASGDLQIDANLASGSSSHVSLQPLLESVLATDECKKRKRSSEDKLFNSDNDLLLEKQKKEDNLYYKNTALLSVSTLLSNDRQSKLFNVESIEHYLNNLKDQEKEEVDKVLLNSEFQSEKDLLKNIDTFECRQASGTDIVTNEYVGDIEHIFKIGYESAVKSDSKNWQSYLSESEIKKFQEFCLKETIDEQSHDETDDTIYDDNMEEEYFEDETNSEIYDNYPADKADLDENFMKWIPVEKTSEVTNVRNLETDIMNWEHMNTNFSRCSENLWQNGLSFNNVQDFDDWFHYEWQAQVFAIRNYTQQYIYVQEMKKYQETANILNRNN